MKITRTFYLVFTIIVSLWSCKQKQQLEPPKTAQESREKRLEKYGKNPGINAGSANFTITPLDGWERSEKNISGAKFTIIMAPEKSADVDMFRENINVVTEKLPNTIGEEVYLNTTLKYLQNGLENYKLVSVNELKVNNLPATLIHYKHSSNEYKLDCLGYMLIQNNVVYVITCSATEKEFSKYKNDFEKMVNSFTIN